MHPDFTGHRIQGQSLRITISKGINLRQGARSINEGIVFRDPAIRQDADHRAWMGPQILRLWPYASIPQGRKKKAISKQQSATKMPTRLMLRCCAKYHLNIIEGIIPIMTTSDIGSSAVFACCGVRKTNSSVNPETRVKRNVQ